MKINYKIGEKEYYKIPVLKFQQKDKFFYIGKLTIDVLDEISTLRPVEKIEQEDKYKNENNISNLFGLIGSKKEKISDDSFNRPQDLKRADEIKTYIETDENALIPNNIIIGSEEKKFAIDDEEIEISLDEIESDQDLIDIFNNMNGIYIDKDCLLIPKDDISSVIIDGQHRFLGLKKLSKEIKEKFEIPVSFLIGYDQIVMAEIFYTINYTQKTVDKSLLTHLKNSFLEKVTESSIIYEYIKFMNTNKESALQNKIKFPKDTKKMKKEMGEEKKEKEIISLAYFHSELENLVKEYTKQSSRIPIFSKLFKDNENGYIVLQTIINYFQAIKELIEKEFNENSWKLGDIVFTRSIGIGAFLQILPFIILKILESKNQLNNYINIKNISENDFYDILKPIKNINLSEFEKAGGLGLLGKLRNEMIREIGLSTYNKSYVEKNSIQWILEFYIDPKTIKTLA